MDLRKQFLQLRDNDPPPLGNFVNYHIYINKIKKKKVAEHLNVLPSTLHRYFQQTSFQFAILWRISQVTEHNFLMELGERLGIAYETKIEKALRAQLAEKDKQIELMQTRLDVFQEIHRIN